MKTDLKRDDQNFVIGRLSDFKGKAYRDWDKVTPIVDTKVSGPMRPRSTVAK